MANKKYIKIFKFIIDNTTLQWYNIIVKRKGVKTMTKQELINKLYLIADNSKTDGHDIYTAVVKDWEKNGKSRTYLKITRTRDNSTMYQVREYGYYDNVSGEYVLTNKYSDLRNDFDFGGMLLVVKEQVKEETKTVEEAQEAEQNEEIEGLEEIRKTMIEEEKYNNKFQRMMDDEYNDGIFSAKKPEKSVSELKARYPRAAAYIMAENWQYAADSVKAAAGREAVIRIKNGDDYRTVINDMKNAWNKYCDQKIWR